MCSYKGGLCFQPPKGSIHAITDNSMGGDETGHTDHIDNAQGPKSTVGKGQVKAARAESTSAQSQTD